MEEEREYEKTTTEEGRENEEYKTNNRRIATPNNTSINNQLPTRTQGKKKGSRKMDPKIYRMITEKFKLIMGS